MEASDLFVKLLRTTFKVGRLDVSLRGLHIIFAHIMGFQGLCALVSGQVPFPYIVFSKYQPL